MKRILFKLLVLASVVLFLTGSLVYGLNMPRDSVVDGAGSILTVLGVIGICWFFISDSVTADGEPRRWKLAFYAAATQIVGVTAVVLARFVPRDFVLHVVFVPMVSAVFVVLFLRRLYPDMGKPIEFDGQLAVIGCAFIGFLGALGGMLSYPPSGVLAIYAIAFGAAFALAPPSRPLSEDEKLRREKMNWRRAF